MRSLRHAYLTNGGTASGLSSRRSRNHPLRARRSQPSQQIYDRVARREPVRVYVDVAIEWDSDPGSLVQFSRYGASRLRRETELPHQCSELSVVALHHADVRPRQPATRADQYVQPVDRWAIRGEVIWLGEVHCVLGADWYRWCGGELSD